MTHEELIEKVAGFLAEHEYGSSSYWEYRTHEAKSVVSTILAELQEPTDEMMSWGMGTLEDKRNTWRAWINASPLAK